MIIKILLLKYYLNNDKESGYNKTCKFVDFKKSTLPHWIKKSKNLTRRNKNPIY